MVDHGRSSLRLSSMRPLSLDETSAFQNLHLPLGSIGTRSKTTCTSTRSGGNDSRQSRTHHLMQSSESTRMHTQTRESDTCVDIFSSRACGFNVRESLPPSAVWTVSQRSSSATRPLNVVNTSLPDRTHYGMLMDITSLGHGAL